MRMKIRSLTLAAFVLLFNFAVHAQIKLPSIFTDNMVLQQQSRVPVWGWAKAGANITVTTSWNKKSYSIKANSNGKWLVKYSKQDGGGDMSGEEPMPTEEPMTDSTGAPIAPADGTTVSPTDTAAVQK